MCYSKIGKVEEKAWKEREGPLEYNWNCQNEVM